MRTRELIEAGPIRKALGDIQEIERTRYNEGEKLAIGEATAILRKALAAAENPETAGLLVRDYAATEGISIRAVYKRRERGKLKATKVGGKLRIIMDQAA